MVRDVWNRLDEAVRKEALPTSAEVACEFGHTTVAQWLVSFLDAVELENLASIVFRRHLVTGLLALVDAGYEFSALPDWQAEEAASAWLEAVTLVPLAHPVSWASALRRISEAKGRDGAPTAALEAARSLLEACAPPPAPARLGELAMAGEEATVRHPAGLHAAGAMPDATWRCLFWFQGVETGPLHIAAAIAAGRRVSRAEWPSDSD
jgi:hypothetical protein